MDAEHNRDFLNWIEENHFIDSYFAVYKDTLLDMLKEEVPESRYKDVCASVDDVFRRCNEIDYNPDQAVAYIIIHFLDRYYRFWLIYCNLIEKGIFPDKPQRFTDKPQMRMMDIGTGPGPSMYAYSDIMWLLNQYKEEHGMSPSRISIDYAERSAGFRYWFLHHYTERLQMAGHPSCVPFHHGTYSDAHEFDLNGAVTRYWGSAIWYDELQKHVISEHSYKKHVARSFNLIVYSNFLTTEGTVNKFADQIAKAAFWLRNGGLLIVVGANPDDEEYRKVYNRIDEIINRQRYSTWKFEGNCRKVISHERMIYQPNCPIAMQMGEFHNTIFETFIQGDHSRLTDKIWRIFENERNGDGNVTDWWLTVYRRRSRLRRPLR